MLRNRHDPSAATYGTRRPSRCRDRSGTAWPELGKASRSMRAASSSCSQGKTSRFHQHVDAEGNAHRVRKPRQDIAHQAPFEALPHQQIIPWRPGWVGRSPFSIASTPKNFASLPAMRAPHGQTVRCSRRRTITIASPRHSSRATRDGSIRDWRWACLGDPSNVRARWPSCPRRQPFAEAAAARHRWALSSPASDIRRRVDDIRRLVSFVSSGRRNPRNGSVHCGAHPYPTSAMLGVTCARSIHNGPA